MHQIWQWLLNFMGVNFGQNAFSTHMYNFWSGFGGDLGEFAIAGTLVTIYRHHLKQHLKNISPVLKQHLHKESSDDKETTE